MCTSTSVMIVSVVRASDRRLIVRHRARQIVVHRVPVRGARGQEAHEPPAVLISERFDLD